MFFLRSVAPHVFQLIKTAAFRQHDVDHNIHIVDQDPLQGLLAFVFIGDFIAAVLRGFFYVVGYCFHLGSTPGLANDKEVGNCFGYLPEIKGNNIFTFFFPEWPVLLF